MSLPIVFGHQAVWARLSAALDGDRLPHALLFAGPPGIGKALLARRLAARVACAAAAAPCGECNGCRQIAAGSHPDLLLISPPQSSSGKESRQKEIGVEQARALKRFAQLRALSARRKVAIIDDAERLSLAAQNALLKTLEEPPGLALIMLITATPGSLLTTVRSRCHRIAFRPLARAEVADALIAAGVPPGEVEGLVDMADGSPGHALAWRGLGQDTARGDVSGRLAALRGGRYASVLAMSAALGRTEAETAARLEGLLATCHAEGIDAARQRDAARLAQAVGRAEVIGEALRTLRRRNPNRALLGEALALRLARGGWV